MPLGELLTIAGLTPAQAVLVTADLLQTAGASASEPVHAILRADGAVGVAAEEEGVPGTPLRELVDEVLRNARRLPAHPRPHQLRLVRTLEEQVAAAGDPATRAAALREALMEVVGLDAVPRTRHELAALVDAFSGIAISRSVSGLRVNGHAVAAAPVVRPDSLRPRGRAPRQTSTRRRGRRRRILALLIVLALALVAVGYLLLRGPASDLIDDLRGSNGASSPSGTQQPAPSHPAGHHHQAGHKAAAGHQATLPRLAAPASGSVRGVVVQKLTGCGPGTACGVKVTVHLTPAGVSRAVVWRVGVVRSCTRPVAWSPTTTVTAQPGWSSVFASSSVPIPEGRSIALVALTSAPAHAQSRPIPVAGASLHC